MGNNQFDRLGDTVLLAEKNKPGRDFLYKPAAVSDIARRLTFVLFDEIIEQSPTQSRLEVFNPAHNQEDLELLESIKIHGIISPIAVREIRGQEHKQGNREFALVAGHRRVAAGKKAGLRGVEGVVIKPDEDHEVLTLIENLGHRKLSSFEKGMAFINLKEQRDLTVRQVAEVTGLSKSHVGELIQAMQAPEVLKTIWSEGELSPKALVILKNHWPLFEQEEANPLHTNLRSLSRKQASNLDVQLNTGMSLKKALTAINSSGQAEGSKSNQLVSEKKTTSAGPAGIYKEDLLAAIRAVFPKIKEKQLRVLYDFGVVNGVNNPEILWAAALYVDRGGNLNQAVELTTAAMAKRSRKSYLTRQVKLMRQLASYLKTMTKEDKTIRDYLQVVFSWRS